MKNKLDTFEKKFIIERLLEEAERLEEELSQMVEEADKVYFKNSLEMIDTITKKLEKDVDTIKI